MNLEKLKGSPPFVIKNKDKKVVPSININAQLIYSKELLKEKEINVHFEEKSKADVAKLTGDNIYLLDNYAFGKDRYFFYCHEAGDTLFIVFVNV